MDQKLKNILKPGLIIVLILALIFIFSFFIKKNNQSLNNQNNSLQNQTSNNNLDNINVVEKDTAVQDENIAKPKNVTPASPVSDASLRDFEVIVAENNKFSPEIITAYKGDIINFYIKAVDKDYDWTQPDYGFSNFKINKGETKKIQFQASAEGKFMFYCESCGGPDKGPIGYIIVKSKK